MNRSIAFAAILGAVVAGTMEGERENALAGGCNECEIEPVDLARLREKLARLLALGGG